MSLRRAARRLRGVVAQRGGNGVRRASWIGATLGRPGGVLRLCICLALAVWTSHTLRRGATAPTVVQQQPEAITDVQTVPVDIEAMAAWRLFGRRSETAPLDAPESVQESSRSIALTGVILAGGTARDAAILQEGDRQRRYQVGDVLPMGDGLTLAQVLADRVLLYDGSRYETVRLYAPRSTQVADDIAPLADVAERPPKLADLLRLTMQREGNQLAGFRVQPGADLAAFGRTGLLHNDLITAINGSSLTEPETAIAAYETVLDSRAMAVTVRRDGYEMDLYVDLR